MFSINSKDKNPIYQQIMEQLVLFISTGLMSAGDKLPSIRELASDLGINPNTVARAYTELERNGIIETIPKKGAFIADRSFDVEIENRAKADFSEVYSRYRQYGLKQDRIVALAEEGFRDAENNELN